MPVTATAAPLATDAVLERTGLAGQLARVAHAVTTAVPAGGLAAVQRVADLAEALARGGWWCFRRVTGSGCGLRRAVGFVAVWLPPGLRGFAR